MAQTLCSIRMEKSCDLHLGGRGLHLCGRDQHVGGRVNISSSLSVLPSFRSQSEATASPGLCEESHEVIYSQDVLTPVRSMYKW